VQSVYDLAIYQESRDVQRLDEFFETLQWNVCHPDVSTVHLFVEDEGGSAFMQRHINSPSESPLIDLCSKVHFHELGHTMRYSDSVKLANELLGGQVVLMLHADVYAGIIFSHSTTEFLLGSKMRMWAVAAYFISAHRFFSSHSFIMFGLTRHERPSVSCSAALFHFCSYGDSHVYQGFPDRDAGSCCEPEYAGSHDAFM
jgi:hypothetical protein